MGLFDDDQGQNDWQDVSNEQDDWQDVPAHPAQAATQPKQQPTRTPFTPYPGMQMFQNQVLGDEGEPDQQEPDKGLLQQWDESWINRPLSKKITYNGQQIFDPKAAAEYYDPTIKESEDQWRIPEAVPFIGGGSLRSLGAGMLEGAGNVVESLTTPLSLATMGAGTVYGRAAKTAAMVPGAIEGLTAADIAGAASTANKARTALRGLSTPLVVSGAARAKKGYETGNYGDIFWGLTEAAGGGHAMTTPHVGGRVAGIEEPMPVREPAAAPAATPESMPVRPPETPARPPLDLWDNYDTYADWEAAGPIERYPPKEPIKSPESPEFDPASLKGLERTPTTAEPPKSALEFVDPETGEIKPAAEAQPGDVPLVQESGEPITREQPTGRVSKRFGPISNEPIQRAMPEEIPGMADMEAGISPEMEQSFQLADEDTGVNASGESAASAEAMSRQAGMKARGEQFVVRDRAGNERPLIGPEAVDYQPRPGETYGVKGPTGFRKLAGGIGDFLKGESGEMNPDAIVDFLRGGPPEGMPPPEAPVERRINPELVSRDNRAFLDRMDEEGLRDFVQRQSQNANYTSTETGKGILAYAQDLIDARGRGVEAHGPGSAADLAARQRAEFERATSWTSRAREQRTSPRHEVIEPLEQPKVPPTEEQRTKAFSRLGKILGGDVAEELTTGGEEIRSAGRAKTTKRSGGVKERVDPREAEHWNRWGDSTIRDYVPPDKGKPGLSEWHSSESDMFPDRFELHYRDANGDPLGVLVTDNEGHGVTTFAVNSELGLRRGKIAVEMFKEAWKRGIRGASGHTSSYTRNFIDRISKIARGEEGHFDVDALTNAANSFFDTMKGAGKKVGEFLSDESGEFTPEEAVKRLRTLSEKRREGSITPDELREARQLENQTGEQLGGRSPTPAFDRQQGPKLPKALAGAKPRFNIGTDFYIPKFADDLDKAAFTIAQPTKNARHADYLQFVMDHTGLDEKGAVDLGRQIRATLKNGLTGMQPGAVDIPAIAQGILDQQRAATGSVPRGQPTPPNQPAQTYQGYTQGQPQVSTGPVNPANQSPGAPVGPTNAPLPGGRGGGGRPPNNATGTPPRMQPPPPPPPVPPGTPPAAAAAAHQGLIRDAISLNKGFLTAWDLSAPGRQGKALMFTKAWWTSLDDMVKAWKDPAAAKMINDSIENHPSGLFKRQVNQQGQPIVGSSFAEKVGLDLASTEEMFSGTSTRAKVGQAIEKYSGIGKASRAHTAFLNKLRSDHFFSMMKDAHNAGLDPTHNLNIAKDYATFINDATGRGSLNIGDWKLERNAKTLSDVMFAPKNLAGQIRTWNNVLNPLKYVDYDPILRKQALKSLMAVAGLGMGTTELFKLAGAKVSNDPTSADFRKIRIRGKRGEDTRIDLFSGYQQFPVAAMKLIMGEATSTSGKSAGKTTDLTAGKFGQQTRASVAERFFTNRLAPVPSFIWAWMNNRDFDGKTFQFKKAAFERILPIAMKDVYDIGKENPLLAGALAPGILSGAISTQHYSGRY